VGSGGERVFGLSACNVNQEVILVSSLLESSSTGLFEYGFKKLYHKRQPWFRKEVVMNGISKTPKTYSFDKSMFLETTRFVASKHLVAFKTKLIHKTIVFLQYFKDAFHPNRVVFGKAP